MGRCLKRDGLRCSVKRSPIITACWFVLQVVFSVLDCPTCNYGQEAKSARPLLWPALLSEMLGLLGLLGVIVPLECIPIYRCQSTNITLTQILALQSSSRNCSPLPDVVLWKLMFQCVPFSLGAVFSQTRSPTLRATAGRNFDSRWPCSWGTPSLPDGLRGHRRLGATQVRTADAVSIDSDSRWDSKLHSASEYISNTDLDSRCTSNAKPYSRCGSNPDSHSRCCTAACDERFGFGGLLAGTGTN